MPLPKLDKDEADRLLQLLGKKMQQPLRCTVCGKHAWAVSDTIYQLTSFSGGTAMVGSPTVPLARMTCSTCGAVLLFDAVAIGFVNPNNWEVIQP